LAGRRTATVNQHTGDVQDEDLGSSWLGLTKRPIEPARAMPATDNEQEFDKVALIQIHGCSPNIPSDGAESIFEFSNEHISISLFPSSSGQASEDHLIALLEQVLNGNDDERHEEVIDEILDVMLDVGRSQFLEVAPRQVELSGKVELHSLLYPERFNFRLQSREGKARIILIAPDETYTIPESQVVHDIKMGFQIDS